MQALAQLPPLPAPTARSKDEVVGGHLFSDDDHYENNDSCCDEFGIPDGDLPISKTRYMHYKAMAQRGSSAAALFTHHFLQNPIMKKKYEKLAHVEQQLRREHIALQAENEQLRKDATKAQADRELAI